MKLKLTEETLSIYINEAIKQELDEAVQPKVQYPNEYPYKADKNKTAKFQTWFNKQNFGTRLVVDGIWGPKTEAAYQQWLTTQK